MTPEQDQDGIWFVILPDGQRKTFGSNAEAWRWLDRHERREGWVSSQRQWRRPPTYAVPPPRAFASSFAVVASSGGE
jgi:hypothetical protein